MPLIRVGMIGGGQLARMTHQAAVTLDLDFEVLAESLLDPAVLGGAPHVLGSPTSLEALRQFAARNTVVTLDHDRVSAALALTLANEGYRMRPGAPAIGFAQDKLLARRVLAATGFPVPPVEVIDAASHLPEATCPGEFLVEGCVDLAAEVVVVAARSPSGFWSAYPLVEIVHREGVRRELVMPARISEEVAKRALAMAKSIADGIDVTGIVAVDFLVTRNDTLMVNELAVGPHNSGSRHH